MMKKKHEPTPLYRAMVEKRASNAATPHKDARTKRARNKKTAMKRELRTYD